MDTRTILLDVGGTFIKCSDGREIPIDSNGCREDIASSLREAVSGGPAGLPERVAVAIPGPFDYENGIFLMKHKFAAVYGERFADIAGAASYRFIHDVNAMLLGEMTSGNGRDYRRVALITLGTGLGFSMSIDGEILKGDTGSPKVPIWNLPWKGGILEDYASKRGFLRGYDGISVKDLADLARNGDAAAAERFGEVGSDIATAVAPLMEEYGIGCLLFGGQISRSFDLFETRLRQELASVSSLKRISPVSDISNATFNGLKALFQ